LRDVVSTRYIFVCPYCGKSKKIQLKNAFGLGNIVSKHKDFKEGQAKLKELQEARR